MFLIKKPPFIAYFIYITEWSKKVSYKYKGGLIKKDFIKEKSKWFYIIKQNNYFGDLYMAHSMLFKEMNYTGNKDGMSKLTASLKHSLRINNEYKGSNINWDRLESGHNVYYNYIKDTKEEKNYIEYNQEKILNEILNLFQESNAKNEIESTEAQNIKNDITRMRQQIQRIINNAKDGSEKYFWEKLYEIDKDGDLPNTNDYIKKLEGLGKIKQFKRKFERVENFFELYNKYQNLKKEKKVIKDKRAINVTEAFLKFPLTNDVELTANESHIMLKDFYEKNFPELKIVAVFEHNDEKYKYVKKFENGKKVFKETEKDLGKHAHIFLQVPDDILLTNLKFEKIINYMKNLKIPKIDNDGNFIFNENGDVELSEETFDEDKIKSLIGEPMKQTIQQQKNMGFFFQEIAYNFFNKHQILKDKNIQVKKYANMPSDKKLQKEIKEKISRDDTIAVQNRLAQGMTLKQEILKDLDNQIQVEQENKKTNWNTLEYQKNTIQANNEAMKEQNEKLKQNENLISEQRPIINRLENTKKQYSKIKLVTDYENISSSVMDFINKHFEIKENSIKKTFNKITNTAHTTEYFLTFKNHNSKDLEIFQKDLIEFIQIHKKMVFDENLYNQIEQYKTKSEELEQDNQKAQNEISQLKQDIQKQNEDIASFEASRQRAKISFNRELEKGKAEAIQSSLRIIENKNNEIKKLNAKNTEISNQLKENKLKLETAQARIDSFVVEVEELNETIKNINSSKEHQTEEIKYLKHILKEYDIEYKNFITYKIENIGKNMIDAIDSLKINKDTDNNEDIKQEKKNNYSSSHRQ